MLNGFKFVESSFSNRLSAAFRCSGVYGIRHDASGRIYVGSSKCVRTRIYQHLRALLAKRHHSRHFQRAWNKYGQEAFTVFLLEKVGASKMLDEREQFWMDYFRGLTKTFNSAPKAESTRGYKWTESQKKKIRGYRRGVWTPDSHRRVSEALKQRHAKNPEWRKNAQKWLHSPENEAKRIAAFTTALKRPEIYNPLVQHLDEIRKLPARTAGLRKIYFEKFSRKSLGFNSPEEMDQACLKLHLEGKSCREIGRLFNIDHHGVSSRLRRLGVSLKRGRQYANTLENKVKAIDAEVQRLHFKWKYFRQLFGSNEKVALLNDTAPVFFGYLWNSLLFDILLSIARLLDPRASRGKENLSFENLLSEISDSSLQAELSELISKLKGKTQAIDIWRKEKLAHNDLSRSLNSISLPSVQADELTEALAIIREIMNILNRRFNGYTMIYEECFAPEPEDGKSLLFYLKYGFDASREDYDNSDLRREGEISKWLEEQK